MSDDDDKVDDSDVDPLDDSGERDDHKIPEVTEVHESGVDEAQFQEPVASPGVTGEEESSGDAPGGEPHDIDKALADLGLENDVNGPKPLSSDDLDE